AAYMCVSLKSTPRPPTSALSPYTTLFRSGRNMSEYFQLRFRFDVKTKNTYVQRACHSRPCFAHTREHNSLGLAARAQHPLQLTRSEEHTSELQSRENLVCRLLPEKKKNKH